MMEAMDWEPALTLPLPQPLDVLLLNRACDQVIEYLNWIVNDLSEAGEPDEIRAEIGRCAERLIELSLLRRSAG